MMVGIELDWNGTEKDCKVRMKIQNAFRFSIMVVKGHFNSFSPKHLPKKILFAVKPATKIFDSDDVIADGQKNFDLHIAI